MDNRKICKQCGKVKEHGVNRANPDGLMGSRCKDCELERMQEYRKRPDVIQKQQDRVNHDREMKGKPPLHTADVFRNYWPIFHTSNKGNIGSLNPKYSTNSNQTEWFSLEKLNQVYNRWSSR
tara:strand:- start:443 stop:808 length:366 start_codon:yes stop_codon:yes gene_type:complete